MRVINIEELRIFAKLHPQARKPLNRWLDVTTDAIWKNFGEVKQSFGSADYVRGWVIFDIAGNLYRLIARIKYEDKIVIVENMFTHKEYDKWQP